MTLKTTMAVAACAAVLSAGAAFSATTTLTNQGSNIFGSPNWSENVERTISSNPNGGSTGAYENVPAGMYRLVDSAMQSVLAFCIEPGVFLNTSASYDTSAAPDISSGRLSVIKQLYNTAYSAVTNASTAAAFQIAIWEIAVENTGGTYDVHSGNHLITGYSSATMNTAQSFLDGLSGPATGTYTFTTYHNEGQDLITATPTAVPLPAAGFLILSALGGLGAMRRRRKS